MNGIRLAMTFPYLFLKSKYFDFIADRSKLPGFKFNSFGRKIAFRLLFKGIFSPKLFLNPVSIVRYFEYDFIETNLSCKIDDKILDVSSPYLFGFYVTGKFSVDYHYINPDKNDLSQLQSKAVKLKFKGDYKTADNDATNLSYKSEYFDSIISISVIEHINDDHDTLALTEMWKTLKPGGQLLLTFPVSKNYYEEFRGDDVYNLGSSQKNKEYFFQRIYDDNAIEKRILNSFNNFEILNKKIFGETYSDFYQDYKKRWVEKSYFETVKDPFYISKYFKEFESVDKLPGIGVMGLSIRKKS